MWIGLVVVGVVAIGIAALFWFLGTEEGDRISGGISAGAGLLAVVLGLLALRTNAGREPGDGAAGRGQQNSGVAMQNPHVTMHNHTEGEGQTNVLGQGVQHIDQRKNSR
jgi:hypothetical protein